MAKNTVNRKRAKVVAANVMSDVEKDLLIADTICQADKPAITENHQKGWFCAAICSDGSLFMDEADSPVRILEILSGAIIAWVDFRTDDFEKQPCISGTLLGFSDQLISSLSGA